MTSSWRLNLRLQLDWESARRAAGGRIWNFKSANNCEGLLQAACAKRQVEMFKLGLSLFRNPCWCSVRVFDSRALTEANPDFMT